MHHRLGSLMLLVGSLLACRGTGDVGLTDQRFPPSCEVTWPAQDTELLFGQDFELAVAISDSDTPPEELSFRAVSDLDGILPGEPDLDDIGATLDVAGTLLREGYHTLTITVSDEAEVAECEASFFVVPNTDPSVNFYGPSDQDVYLSSENILVDISVFDNEETDQAVLDLVWNGIGVDQPTAPEHPDGDGVAQWYLPLLPAGSYTLGVRVTDPVGGSRTSSVTFSVIPTDGDGDGWISLGDGGTDCDDTNFAINPSQLEVCNGVDDDCDGAVDEADAFQAPEWYLDGDGDGHGDPTTLVVQCTQPPGYIGTGGDCDDADVTVRPGGDEYCDGVDNDCNGEIDDAPLDGDVYYTDADGDTFGDLASPTTACAPSAGVSTDATDCNDGDAAAHPLADEQCGNGQDDDCDGAVDEACFIDHCGLIDTAVVWGPDATHRVTCPVEVESTLTVLAGTEVMFRGNGRIEVARSAPGRLLVNGTASDPVVFRPELASLPAGQLWFGRFDTGSALAHFSIEGTDDGRSAIYSEAPYLDLVDGQLSLGTSHGIEVADIGDISVVDCRVEQMLGDGLHIDGFLSALEGTTLTANLGYPVSLPPDEVSAIGLLNDLTGNWLPGVEVQDGWVSQDAVWSKLDVPYLIDDGLPIGGLASPVLTIEPGATLRFSSGRGLSAGKGRPGSLFIDAASDPVVLESRSAVPVPGAWRGVDFGAFDQGSQVDGLVIQHADSAVRLLGLSDTPAPLIDLRNVQVIEAMGIGIDVEPYSLLSLVDSTIRGGDTTGMRVEGGLAAFAGNQIVDNNGTALSIVSSAIPSMSASNTFSGNISDVIALRDSPVYDADFTWPDGGTAYSMAYDPIVVDGVSLPTLTIDDGVEIRFGQYSGILVQNGSLQVGGAVLLTGKGSSPSPGDWPGVRFYGNGHVGPLGLDGLSVHYAGGSPGWSGAMRMSRSDIGVIRGLSIRYSSDYGLFLDDTADVLQLDACVFEGNGADGLRVIDGGRVRRITNSTMTGNQRPIYFMKAENADAVEASNVLSGNQFDSIYIRSFTGFNQVDEDTRFRALDADWIIGGIVRVGDAVTPPVVTIDPGVVLQMVPGAEMVFGWGGGAELVAVGTASQPIRVTSSSATPAPGDWEFWEFDASTTGTVRHAVFEYGGNADSSNVTGNVRMDVASPIVLDQVELRESGAWGLYGMDLNQPERPDLSTVTFSGNTLGDTNF